MKIPESIKREALGEKMPSDQFRIAVRKLINDRLDAFFDEVYDDLDEYRTGVIATVAGVAANWISENIVTESDET